MNRDALIAAMQATAAQAPRPVNVPGWGEVFVRSVTVEEIEAQTEDTEGAKDKHKIARGVARVLCDAEGNALLDPTNDEHVKLIAKQPWPLLRRIIAVSDQKADPGN